MKYEITLQTDDAEYMTIVDGPSISLENVITSPGMLVGLAIAKLNADGTSIKDDDVINVSIRELDDYEEYLHNEGEVNE